MDVFSFNISSTLDNFDSNFGEKGRGGRSKYNDAISLLGDGKGGSK